MTSALSSITSIKSSSSGPTQIPEGVVLHGYHKKLKTMKKKYFVLWSDTEKQSARLEYYDNERKFKSRSNPKRKIILKNCFNIFRRLDTKYDYVISLSMKDEGFCMVLQNENELNKWLRTLLALQRGENAESDPPKPTFEHVWQVVVRPKGLAEERGILGSYYVCLTMKSLTLIPIGHDRDKRVKVDFLLTTIRRCGNSQCYFYMEVGRYSAFGAGELWMETTDPLIAQNMHTLIISAMTNSVKNRDDIGMSGVGAGSTQMRKRSSSANETSKPISVMHIRQTTSSNRPLNSSPLSGSTMGRERCDSLPSRNRTASDSSNHSIIQTTMPPPRTIPTLSNRPHSMYNNRHSHSPPMSTLSPSTGCSESEGSSWSIDETDSVGHSLTPDESGNFVSRYYNSRSGGVIPEENCDDFWYADNNKPNSNETYENVLDKLNNHQGVLSLPITANQNSIRRGSPASHVGSIENQGQYMDMCSPYSPCGSSPCDQTGSGYMPISPGVEFSSRGLYTESSGGHSRASSLAEETGDGYVPMCPPSSSQDYVDMEQGSQKQQNLSGFSSAASSCSITSGTPSTDVRFAEYPLDKVQSRFTPDDEELQSANERPLRTYSVGSRLEHNKRKLRIDMINAQECSRVRAFSVGSRAKVPRCDIMYRGGVFTPNLIGSHINNNYNTEITSSSIIGGVIGITGNKGKKSSSAPILVHKSQSSVDRMSDLMEIDFSKNSAENNDNNDSPVITPSPIRVTSFPIQVPFTNSSNSKSGNIGQFVASNNSPKTGFNTNTIGYVEMRPGISEKAASITSIKSAVDTVDGSGYLEMKPVGLSKSPSLSSSPLKSFYTSHSSQKANSNQKSSSFIISPKSKSVTGASIISSNDYMNISPPNSAPNSLMLREAYNNNNNNNNNNNSIKICNNNNSNNNNNNNNNDTNCHNPSLMNSSLSAMSNDKLMEIDDFSTTVTKISDTPEGYMEMSFGENSKNDIKFSSSIDYGDKQQQSFAGRSISSPIDIKSKDKKGFELTLSEAFVTKNRYRSDSSDSSNIIVTPSCSGSSHGVIFPFSPGSPLKTSYIQNDFARRKCLIDGTSGTLTISEDSSSSSSKDEKYNEQEKLMNTINLSETLAAAKETKILNTDTSYRPQKEQQPKLQTQSSSSSFQLQEQNQEQSQNNLSVYSENVEALSNDYADMTLNSELQRSNSKKDNLNVNISPFASNVSSSGNNNNTTINDGDYVNYAPQLNATSFASSSYSKPNTSKLSVINSDPAGDYAIMKPVTTISYQQSPLIVPVSTTATTNNKRQLPISFGCFGLERAKTFEGFKSIASTNDEMFLRNDNAKTKRLNSPKLLNTSSSSTNNKSRTDDGYGYELLQMRSDSSLPTVKKNMSRPNSVNSEKISPLKASTHQHCRPNSVNSECMQSSISNSSSSSTLCGGNSGSGNVGGNSSSSSSTLCGSKSQSPLTNSRPQSFSDTTITSSSSSRPESVGSVVDQGNVVTSRPPSVSSERELHYASLDLPPASNSGIISSASGIMSLLHHHQDCIIACGSGVTTAAVIPPVSGANTNNSCLNTVIGKGNSSTSGESSTSPSPIINNNQQQQPAFTYAKIDFNKSEFLKQTINAATATSSSASTSTSTSNMIN